MYDAGRFDQRITFRRRVASVNGYGENAYTWEDLPTQPEVWAQAEPLRGREFFAAAQAESEVTVRFRIVWRADVDATMQVLWRGVAHDISSEPIDPNGAKEVIELMCVAGVRDGR